MKERSSKVYMESILDSLSGIHEVEAPSGLFEKIMLRIQENKQNRISLTWISAAAAILMFCFSLEFYAVAKRLKQTESNQEWVNLNDNKLYNE